MSKYKPIRLGNLVNIRTGKLDANASSENGRYPFFTCSKEPLKINTFSYDCECVLVAGNGDLNVKYYDGKFDAYQRTYIIESIDKGLLDVKYLYFFLEKYIEKLRNYSIGGIIKYIRLANLTDSIIPLTSLDFQKQIIKTLDKASEITKLNKKRLEELDNLIKSVFYCMFGNPIINNKGYNLVKLSDLGALQSGGTPARGNKDYYNGHINWFTAGELNNLYLTDSIEKITEDAIKNSSTKLFPQGSLLIGMYDTAAFKMGILTRPSCSNQACANIQVYDSCNVIWLYYNLLFMKEFFLSNRRGIRQKNLNLGMIKQFEIPLPDLALQNTFSTIIDNIEGQKTLFKLAIAESENLFNGLLNQYFD